jgi:hypothetical protein
MPSLLGTGSILAYAVCVLVGLVENAAASTGAAARLFLDTPGNAWPVFTPPGAFVDARPHRVAWQPRDRTFRILP